MQVLFFIKKCYGLVNWDLSNSQRIIYIILQSRRGRRPRRPEFVTLRWRYFWRKSNQNVGVATPPHPNAAQVWNAISATNRAKL